MRRRPRIRGSVVGVALLLGLAVLTPAPAAQAQTGPVQVLIESVTPASPDRTSNLTLGGRIANTGDETIFAPSVELRFSPNPLSSREEVSQVLTGETGRTGNPLVTTTTAIGRDLLPGQQSEFHLSIPVKDLGLPDSPGVYAMFVAVTSGGVSVGDAGTVFPWFPRGGDYRRTHVALMWPISQKPAVAAHDLVVDPALPGQFAPDGRLGRLLAAGQGHDVNWLVDASVDRTATDLADGYDVVTGSGAQPGDQTAAAAAFAADLKPILANPATTHLPQYAIADDDALTRDGQTATVVRSVTLPQVMTGTAGKGGGLPFTYFAPGGNAEPATLETLVDAGVRQVLVSDVQYPPEPALSYTPSGVTTIDVKGTNVTGLLIDSRIARILRGPYETAADRCRTMQAFLGETAMITLERPGDSRSIVAMPPLQWNAPADWLSSFTSAVEGARWIHLVSLRQVARAQQVGRLRAPVAGSALRELPSSYLHAISDLQGRLDTLASIVDDPAGFTDSFSLSLQRATSSMWRNRRDQRDAFLATIAKQIDAELKKVRVVSSGTITLAGDSGFIPLTIANDFDRSVTVGLQLRADNAVQLEYTPPPPVQIEANAKKGIEVPVRVVGSQPMQVAVVLTDKEGTVYDDSASLELRSTAATQIAGIVVGVGGVTLAVLVAFNLWRRRRTRSDAEPSP